MFQPLTFVSEAHSSAWLDLLKEHLSPRAELTPPVNFWKYEGADVMLIISASNVISPNAVINMAWENTQSGHQSWHRC